MLSVLRTTAHDMGTLWLTIGRVIRARGAAILLLLLLGWACYFTTILATGFIAPYWPWAAIPLMGMGCLAQLIVTLAAYRTAIEYADTITGTPALKHFALMPLVSTMIVPFAAAYSAFGYFTQFAHDAMTAASGLVGIFADADFLDKVNPLASVRTLVITVIAFVGFWIGSRVIQRINIRISSGNYTLSTILTLLSALFSICNTFLVLFSIFRVYGRLRTWLLTREFMAWGDSTAAKVASVTHIPLPDVINAVWTWIATILWPLFWNVLSQPVLWLSVIALVGGMQFIDANTIWNRLRQRLGATKEQDGGMGSASVIPNGLSQTVLPFFHLLWVILKSGVSFLVVLVLSYAAVDQVGVWADFGIAKIAGPIPTKYVLLVQPLFELFSMVITTGCLAILLATAYVRLCHYDSHADQVHSRRLTWHHLVIAIVGIALAIGISVAAPGSSDRNVRLTPGVPATVMSSTVTISNLRVGHSLQGKLKSSSALDTPIQSEGLFVAVNLTVSSYAGGTFTLKAVVNGVTYQDWDSTNWLTDSPGFTISQDVVFEIPADQIDNMTITITPLLSFRSIIALGTYRVPSDTSIETIINVDESSKEWVP